MVTAKVFSRFPQIVAELPHAAKEGMREGAQEILEDANNDLDSRPTSGQSPDTPPTSGTGSVEDEGEGVVIKYDAYWAHWIEFGSGHAPAHPFLFPAAERGAPELLAKVVDALGDL